MNIWCKKIRINPTGHCNPFSRQNSLWILETERMFDLLFLPLKDVSFWFHFTFAVFLIHLALGLAVFLPVEPGKVSSMKLGLSAAPCTGLHSCVTFFLFCSYIAQQSAFLLFPSLPPSLDLFNFTMGLCRNVRLALAKAFWWPLSPIIIVTNKSLKMTVTLQAQFQWLAASSAV